MSPDAFAQLTFQLAHRRVRGRVGATYEAIATRQFRTGRTEAMRVVTPELVRFATGMDDPAISTAARAELARAAADAHVTRARQCRAGAAPEQHLWALQMIAAQGGTELGVSPSPALYDSPGWVVMREDRLSTSSVPRRTCRSGVSVRRVRAASALRRRCCRTRCAATCPAAKGISS